MMENRQAHNLVDRLGDKVSQVMHQLQEFKGENEQLGNEVMTLKAQNEAYRAQIARLEEENAAKEREIEEIVNKIESILG